MVPLPSSLADLERAAQRAHPGHRHVDADAAAGDAAHRLRGAEAGPREHPEQQVVRQRVDVRGPTTPSRRALARIRSRSMPRPSSATRSATVFRSRASPRAGCGPRPACPPRPLLRRLDAVIDRVAQQVQQRVADLVEHRAIELDLLALDVEPDPLAESRARSRTSRGNRSNTSPTGVIRAAMTSLCIADDQPGDRDR